MPKCTVFNSKADQEETSTDEIIDEIDIDMNEDEGIEVS